MENNKNGLLTDRKRNLIFICIIVSGVASSTLATAMTTALPSLVEYFHVSASTGQWITSGYSLVMGMVLPLTAFLITKFPTKWLYTAGIACFIAGLAFSIFAGSFFLMMIGRVLQACGNGVLMSSAQVIILSVYPSDKKGTMMGIYGLASTAAPIIAPTLAGFLIDSLGWKSIFYIVLGIMMISLILSLIVFENVLELHDKKFDVLSFAESIIAFGGITLGIGNIGSYGLLDVKTILPLAAGILVCVLFVLRQCRAETPFLDIKIMKSRDYAISVIASMILYLVMMGSSVMMPLYVQSVMGFSAVVSGLVTLPGSLATALVSPFAGRKYDKMGIKNLFIVGSAALVISNLGMFFVHFDTSLIVATVLNVIRNISIGSLMMPLLTWGVSNVDVGKVADASSLLTSFRTIAGSVGSAVFVGIMNTVSAGSEAVYGETALMHGMNVSFLCMAAGAAVLLLTAVFTVRKTA